MTEPRRPAPDDAAEDWLDALLRRDAQEAPQIEDQGFTAGVLAALPPRPRRAASWVVPISAVLACILGFYVLGGAEHLFDAVLDLVTEGKFGGMQMSVLTALLVLYVCAAGSAWSER